MTKREIIDAVTTAVMEQGTSGIDDVLTETDNVACTNAGAGALDTVNPTNNYPPTPR